MTAQSPSLPSTCETARSEDVPRKWLEELAYFRVRDIRGSDDVPGFDSCVKAELNKMLQALAAAAEPIDMLLFCPSCGKQHVDAPDGRTPDWKNPPHKSHLCHFCKNIWRPADVPTNGVTAIETRGNADTWTAPLTGRSVPAHPTPTGDVAAKLAEIRKRHAEDEKEVSEACLPAVNGLQAHEDRAFLLPYAERAAALEHDLAAAREKFTMHTAHVHAWFSALVQEMSIAKEGETVSVSDACSKAMGWVDATRECANKMEVALRKIILLCEQPSLDPFQVPSHVYQSATEKMRHETKAIARRALGEGR